MYSSTDELLHYYKIIVKSQLLGKTNLPYGLGLNLGCYQDLLMKLDNAELNQLDKQWQQSKKDKTSYQEQRNQLVSELIATRDSEKHDLITLLKRYQQKKMPWTGAACTIVATACLSSAHLWKSLGFNQRLELSQWLTLCFPSLVAKNTKNMRWKRFFYLQLCQEGGDYLCRAPSCDECSSYQECFVVECSVD